MDLEIEFHLVSRRLQGLQYSPFAARLGVPQERVAARLQRQHFSQLPKHRHVHRVESECHTHSKWPLGESVAAYVTLARVRQAIHEVLESALHCHDGDLRGVPVDDCDFGHGR